MAFLDDEDMASDEEVDGEGEGDELTDALSKAFPDGAWDAERVAAFREAMTICNYSTAPEESDEADDEEVSGDVALLFGKSPKKKG